MVPHYLFEEVIKLDFSYPECDYITLYFFQLSLFVFLSLSLSFLYREASVFLKRGPQRIGPIYKKAVYKQYSDATYRTEVTKPAWLGYLGPLIAAEQGDTVIIHLRNTASRAYSIHPHGQNYSKSSEGEQYVAQRYDKCMDSLHSRYMCFQEPYTQITPGQSRSVMTSCFLVPR